MAYQNVGTPRFYIDTLLWLKTLGLATPDKNEDIFALNPSDIKNKTFSNSSPGRFWFNIGNQTPFPNGSIDMGSIDYIAYLGHEAVSTPNETPSSQGYTMNVRIKSEVTGDEAKDLWRIVGDSNYTEIVNMKDGDEANYDGFTIIKVEGNNGASTLGMFDEVRQFNNLIRAFDASTAPDDEEYAFRFGCASIGSIYDMPHSPDLSLKMSIESDGVKTIQTKGGATLTNASYTKPADWGDRGAWQLGSTTNPNPPNLRNGRRTWDLSFSYLSDRDVFPANAIYVQSYPDAANSPQQMIDLGYHDDDINSTGGFETNILTGTDFFSQVWNKTAAAGNLPFIFQPNGNNNMPDNFAICRFDMKSLKVTQSMHRKYNVKLKIRECW